MTDINHIAYMYNSINNDMNHHHNNNPNGSSPMHLGMAGPPGGVNPFTADEIQELMGLIPGDQQQQQQQNVSTAAHGINPHHQQQQQQQLHPMDQSNTSHQQQQQQQMDNLDNMHPAMHMNAVAVPNGSSSGLKKGNEVDDSTKNHARSERKRSREKQRRTDVNKQFGELTEVLKRIESEEQQLQQERALREEQPEGTKTNQPSRMVLPPFSPTNRVDLIARTIAHLERLSHVTKKQIQEVLKLEEQLKTAQKAGEDMAQKLKDAVFNHQYPQNGTMMMNGMMGNGMGSNGNQLFSPMQMAMGGMNPMAANPATNGMMSIQPQKQQMMMMVPMMMPGAGANGATGTPAAPMMPAGGNQPFMMMPQAFMPSQQPQQNAPAPGPSSTSTNANNTPKPPAPAPAPLQNQQAMMMQQAIMMQSMQPMMQQMQMMQPQGPRQQQQQQQPQIIFSAPQQPSTQPAPSAPIAAPVTAGMQASQQIQQQQQQPTQQRLSPVGPTSSSNGSQGSSQTQDPTKGQQQGAGGGSYAYSA